MALQARRRPTEQRPCPTITVTMDTGDFKEGQKLSTWPAVVAYHKAMVPEAKADDEQVRAVVLANPADNADSENARIEAIEALGTEPIEDVTAPLSSMIEGQEASDYQRLGALLGPSFDEHADKMVGKGKEDFDGSTMVIADDILEADRKSKGAFFKQNMALVPFAFPIGYTNKEGVPNPKALPSGSNDIPDRFPYERNGKTVYGSRVASIVSGTKYGSKLRNCAAALERVVKSANSENKATVQPLSEAEATALASQLATIDARLADADVTDEATAQMCLERINKRMGDTVRKFGQAWQLNRQLELMKEAGDKLHGDLKVMWRSKVDAIRHTSKAPLSIWYAYEEPGGTTATPSAIPKLSIGTFVRWDIAKALATHKDGTDFIADLKKTVERKQPEKDKTLVNPNALSQQQVVDVMGGLFKWLKEPANDQVFWETMHDKDLGIANRSLLSLLWNQVNRQYVRMKSDIERDNRELDRQRTAHQTQADKENEAMDREGKAA